MDELIFNNRLSFLELSSALTGFEVIDLEGRDCAEEFIKELVQQIGTLHFNGLIDIWNEIYRSNENLELELRSKLWGSELFGPIVRNIIWMWYVGTWKKLPDRFYLDYDINVSDISKIEDHVVSSHAYQEGLIWESIGAHPPGAKPPGFGSWAHKPF